MLELFTVKGTGIRATFSTEVNKLIYTPPSLRYSRPGLLAYWSSRLKAKIDYSSFPVASP